MQGKFLLGLALACASIFSLPADANNSSRDALVQEFVITGSITQKYAQLPKCSGYFANWHECVIYTYFVNTDHIRSATVYERGKPNGQYRSFYFTGLPLVEKYYVDGVEQGIRTSYSNSGHVLSRVPYVGGIRNGLAYSYYGDSGNLKSAINYKDDQREGLSREYYENGKLSQVAHYHKGELHGKFELYFPNGQKNIEDYYEHGLQDGAAYKFSEQGRLMLLEHYRNGRRHGVTIAYRDNQEPLFSIVFDNDQVVYGRCGAFGKEGRDLSYQEMAAFADGRGYPKCNMPNTARLKS